MILALFSSLYWAFAIPYLNGEEAIFINFNESVKKANQILEGPTNEDCIKFKQSLDTEKSFYKQLDPDGYRYFNCFAHKDENGNKYELDEEQKEVIKKTAQFTNLSDTVLACLAFMESRFDNKAVSDYGAKGVAQFTDATLETLKNFSKKPTEDSLEECKAKKEHEKEFCGIIEMRVKTSEDFQKLSEKVKKEIPDGIKFDPFDKYSSLALSGYYMKFILDNIVKENTGIDPMKVYGQDRLGLIKVALAAYNAGPEKVAGILRDVGFGRSIHEYVDEVRKLSEQTRGHMDGIEDCSRAGLYNGPTEKEKKDKLQCD